MIRSSWHCVLSALNSTPTNITNLYLCLHHEIPPEPHFSHKSKNVHITLCLDSLDLSVNSDECTSPATSIIAVHHNWPCSLHGRVHHFMYIS